MTVWQIFSLTSIIQAKEDGCFELLLLELSTGLRRSGFCALQWSDLSFRTGELRIERQVHRVNGELVVSSPKTKAGNRSVILPAPVLGILKEYGETTGSRWMFPSPAKEGSPRDPAAVRRRLQTILERAECKKVRFHDLSHVFCTAALEHGMDIKTLSTIIGHVSSSTTLNIYAHVTDEMRRTAAMKIDQGIGKADPQTAIGAAPRKPAPSTFQARKGRRRKAGTGCVTQINERLWEGRYTLLELHAIGDCIIFGILVVQAAQHVIYFITKAANKFHKDQWQRQVSSILPA